MNLRFGQRSHAARVGRIIFGALTLFAFSISWRGYVDNVGFTLISLFAGFVIVAALDLGAPVWRVVLIGVAAVLGGRWRIGRVERGVAADDAR